MSIHTSYQTKGRTQCHPPTPPGHVVTVCHVPRLVLHATTRPHTRPCCFCVCARPPDHIRNYVGLTSRSCQDKDVKGTASLMDDKEVDLLRNQVPGWRIATASGKACLRQDWKCKDSAAAQQLIRYTATLMSLAVDGQQPPLTPNPKTGASRINKAVCSTTVQGIVVQPHVGMRPGAA